MHASHALEQARKACAAALVFLCLSSPPLGAEARPRTFGWLEWAWLEPGHTRIKAKLDTGAKTSSIHAEDVELFERDGEEWVRFKVPLGTRKHAPKSARDIHLERPLVRQVLIKEHEGPAARRHVVNVDLCLGGITFTTPVTLADRSRFLYPLLLGRVALQGRAVIDPAQKYLATRRCPGPRT
jgi:hypothetical protein